MSFLNNRLKAIEKQAGVHDSDDFLIVFISSNDGKSVEIRAMLTDGKQKVDTLHTDKDLYNFFGGESSDALCILEDVPSDIETVKGSLYESVIKDDVTSIGKVNINR